MIGYGAVARAALPILFKYIKLPCRNVTVIDSVDKRKEMRPWIKKGVKYYREKLDPINLSKILSTHVSSGGMIIDLACNIDSIDMVRWAHDNRVLYINASVEEWDPYSEIYSKTCLQKSFYHRYVTILESCSRWNNRVTAILDHGANPGLISHLTKRGILDIGYKALKERKFGKKRARLIEQLLESEDFPRLAMRLGIKVIHCSERDTQVVNKPKAPDEFAGMWSIEGMREESISPVEIGWGTHEKELPKHAIVPKYGIRNMIIAPQMGINTFVRSWVPNQEFVGMLITHGESFGISEALTVRRGKKVIYRPTVHYAYLPANETMASLHDLRCRGYELQPMARIMSDEIQGGEDKLGALIMGHCYNSWWTGSVLSIEESRKLIPHQNATTIQVAIGVIAGAVWMIQNPRKGLLFPEDLPYDHILSLAKPYLGKFISEPSDWTPLKNYQIFFKENIDTRPDTKDPWQFKNFIFKP